MRKVFGTLLVLVVLACGGGEFPPEACAPIADQEVFIGERSAVSICFTDPDGGAEVTITASSSDESVVTADVTGRALNLEGVEVGEAVVTLTATDEDAMTGEQLVNVAVPNRAPTAETLPQASLSDETPTLEVNLAPYFEDPDGHELMYSAASLTPDIIEVSVTDSILMISRGEGLGNGGLEATATDTHGASVSARMAISTSGMITVFRDEFDSLDSAWSPDEDTGTEFSNGQMRFWTVTPGGGRVAWMPRRFEIIENWTVSLRIENIAGDTWGGFALTTAEPGGRIDGSPNIQRVWFLYGADASSGWIEGQNPRESNLVMLLQPQGSMTLATDEPWVKKLEGIPDRGVGDPVDLKVVALNNRFTVYVNGVETASYEPAGPVRSLPMSARGIVLVSWPEHGKPVNLNGGSLIDWMEVSGTPRISSDVADMQVEEFRGPLQVRRIER